MIHTYLSQGYKIAFSRVYRGWWLHIAFLISGIVGLFVALHHTPWRDEVLVWLIARNLDFWGIFIETRHHGHPVLWYFCVKLLQLLGLPYIAMNVLNWTFLMTGMWLVCYRSVLPFVMRAGLVLSPLVIFHLSGNARNYAIAGPLILGAAFFYRKPNQKFILFSIFLALSASTNIYATTVFVGLSLQFLLEQCYSFGRAGFSLRPVYTRYLVPNLILLGGALILAAQMFPIHLPDDPVGKTYPLTIHLSNILNVQTLVLYAILIGFVFLKKKPARPRVFAGIPMVLMTLVPALFYGMGTRHAFMLVLGILYLFWIYQDEFLSGGGFLFIAFRPAAIQIGMAFAALAACFVIFPGGIRTTFVLNPASFDGQGAAAAIAAKGLDSKGSLMVTNDPARIASVMLYLKNIDHFYAPPPYTSGPQYFTDYRRGIFYTPTSLADITPYILQIIKEHPEKRVVLVSSDIETDKRFSFPDQAFQAVSIYQSPDPLKVGKEGEFYQIFLVKAMNASAEPAPR